MSTQLQVSETASVALQDAGISLEGNLLFSTVSTLLGEGSKLIEQHKSDALTFDISDVKKVDSAGIALLLNWTRLCDAKNKTCQLQGVSEQVASLIKTNKLENILKIG